jgi:hypothetical protein
VAAAGSRFGLSATPARPPASISSQFDEIKIKSETLKFIEKCARDDGGYSPAPDPQYAGISDTGESDLAAVTYAATLAKTLGWKLPHPERSADFIQRHQQPDGVFISFSGKFDPKADPSLEPSSRRNKSPAPISIFPTPRLSVGATP